MEEKIREFLSVAPDATPQVAQHLIEASKGDVEGAVSQYFNDSTSYSPRPPSPPKPSSSPSNPSGPKKQEKSKEKSKFASLSDFQDEEMHDHSDEEGGQEFFAGGKASGVSVQGPSTAKNPTREAIENILRTADENGRRERERDPEASSNPKKSRVFLGQGNKLGTGEEPEGTNDSPQMTPAPRESESDMDELNYTLTFWEDGFSIDDGPLRSYKDPANEEFLKTLREGQVPHDLKAKAGQPVNIRVAPRIQEKYVPPKKVLKPFSGSGQRLGSEIPGETTGFSSTTPPARADAPKPAAQEAQPVPVLANMNEQLTTIQIRLADGTRMVTKFNPTQTVGDIIRFINMSRTGEVQRNYVIMTTFPNKEYTDLTATIEAAGLLNAVVVQRYK